MYFLHSESPDVHMRTLGNSDFLSDVSVPAACSSPHPVHCTGVCHALVQKMESAECRSVLTLPMPVLAEILLGTLSGHQSCLPGPTEPSCLRCKYWSLELSECYCPWSAK